jgi:hypothetical protein
MGRWSYGAAAEAMVVGICMVFVRVVSCDLCFFGVQLLEKIDSP